MGNKRVSLEQIISLGLRENKGVLIVDVHKDSPAEKADIRQGDVIIGFDGKEINWYGDLINYSGHT